MKNNIKFNPLNNTIEVTKKFLKDAEVIGSEAYMELARVTKDFPNARITTKTIKKNKDKLKYNGLTLKEMERFISTKSETEQELFQRVLAVTEGKKARYAVIKKWFLKKYKEEYLNELASLKATEELLDELEEIEESLTDDEIDDKDAA